MPPPQPPSPTAPLQESDSALEEAADLTSFDFDVPSFAVGFVVCAMLCALCAATIFCALRLERKGKKQQNLLNTQVLVPGSSTSTQPPPPALSKPEPPTAAGAPSKPPPPTMELPAGWSEHVSDRGTPYYCQADTGITRWEHPGGVKI